MKYVEHSVPPTFLATVITGQHWRPFHALPMIFPPVLLFCSYLNLSDFKTDAAGLSASSSLLYLILARRRKQVRHITTFYIFTLLAQARLLFTTCTLPVLTPVMCCAENSIVV